MSRDRIMNTPLPVTISSSSVITTPHAIRDSITTAYVALSGGTKTELVAGVSGYFLDLLQISMANNSGVAVTDFTLFDESTTVQKFSIPLNGATVAHFPAPLRQSAKGVSWYIDMGDTTGTTITVQALFLKTQN